MVKPLILIDYYLICQIKETENKVIDMLLYQILESVVPRGKVERLYKKNKFKASVPS